MGMYDYVKCEYPLPDEVVQNEEFQTKDFDCVMDNYTITSDGRLTRKLIKYVKVPDEERPNYGKPEWDTNTGKLLGSIKGQLMGIEVLDYTGTINFYTIIKEDWFEYISIFENGALVNLYRTPAWD